MLAIIPAGVLSTTFIHHGVSTTSIHVTLNHASSLPGLSFLTLWTQPPYLLYVNMHAYIQLFSYQYLVTCTCVFLYRIPYSNSKQYLGSFHVRRSVTEMYVGPYVSKPIISEFSNWPPCNSIYSHNFSDYCPFHSVKVSVSNNTWPLSFRFPSNAH